MQGVERQGGGRRWGLAVSATFSGMWTYGVRLGIGSAVGAVDGADDPRGVGSNGRSTPGTGPLG